MSASEVVAKLQIALRDLDEEKRAVEVKEVRGKGWCTMCGKSEGRRVVNDTVRGIEERGGV